MEWKSGTALSVWWQVRSLNKKFMGKIFVGDTSLSEKFSWMEANHENNEIKSTTKIFTYTVPDFGMPSVVTELYRIWYKIHTSFFAVYV